MCLQTNSYQVIFVSDSQLSFVFFSYGDIQWSDMNTFAGFNLQGRHFSLPGYQTPAVLDLHLDLNLVSVIILQLILGRGSGDGE